MAWYLLVGNEDCTEGGLALVLDELDVRNWFGLEDLFAAPECRT